MEWFYTIGGIIIAGAVIYIYITEEMGNKNKKDQSQF